MDSKTYRWIPFFVLNVFYAEFCKGQINLVPTNVPWESEQWTLQCSLNSIASTVSITNPSGTTVGFCDPTGPVFPSSCTPNTGYMFAINETANTVSMIRTIANSETGIWTCQHSTDSATYNLSSPLPRRNLPDSATSNINHWMTAIPGSELTTATVERFIFHYGCVSSNLKFVWTTVPGSSSEDTLNTNSDNLTCTTNSAYMSTLDTNSNILQSVKSKGTTLKVSVYLDGYYSLTTAVVEYTYDVTFSPSVLTSTPTPTTKTPPDHTCFFGFISASDSVCKIIIVIPAIVVIIFLAALIYYKLCRSDKIKRRDEEEMLKKQSKESNKCSTSEKYVVQAETHIDELSKDRTNGRDENERISRPEDKKSSSASNDTSVNQQRVSTKQSQQVQNPIEYQNKISQDGSSIANDTNMELSNSKELVHM